MNWKYTPSMTLQDNNKQEDRPLPPQIFISADTSSSSSAGSVQVVENTIFFYAAVTDQTAAELNRALYVIDCKLHNATAFFGSEFKPHIKLKINSPGGDVFACLSILDTITNLRADVHTYIEGMAASAATIISVAGKKRFIGKNSLMMIHQLSAKAIGNFAQLEDNMENMKKIMSIIKGVYKQYTKVPMKNIDEILKHDLWFDSAKCLENGLVDEIL